MALPPNSYKPVSRDFQLDSMSDWRVHNCIGISPNIRCELICLVLNPKLGHIFLNIQQKITAMLTKKLAITDSTNDHDGLK